MAFQEAEKSRRFEEEVQTLRPALRAYLSAHFPTLPDVDNLVQESIVRVFRACENSRVESPRALLFTIARNLARDVVRRQQVIFFEPITEITDSSVFTDSVDVAECVSKKQEFDLLTEAIQSLPDRCRQVFTLRMAYGMTQKQIAKKLEITENTVEKQMAKGVRRCIEHFARHGLP